MTQHAGRESPDPQGRSTQLTQDKTNGQRQEWALAMGEQGPGREGPLAPLQPRRAPSGQRLAGPGAVILATLSNGGPAQQEHPTGLPGHPGLVPNPIGLQVPGGNPGPVEEPVDYARGPQVGGSLSFPGTLEGRRSAAEAPEASNAAGPGPRGREEASAGASPAQQETALRRLLELHSAARHRRQQDRRQQLLRVRPAPGRGGPSGWLGTGSGHRH